MEAIVVLERTDLDVDLPDFARAGTRVGETLLVAQEGHKEASFGQRVWYTVEGILE
jgi:hypothetical protein